MTTMIKGFVGAEENNAMMEQGYKFCVEGDWRETEATDPWSGMPVIASTTHFFTDRTEAEAYAAAQNWPFNPAIHGTVKEMKHEETREEWMARLEREKAEREARKAKKKAEREARDLANGITPEARRLMNMLKRHEAEIRKMEAEIEDLKKRIEKEKEIVKETAEAIKKA